MRSLQIREVITKSDQTAFLRMPWVIYKGNPYWVPPLLSEQRRLLDRKENPYFRHAEYKAWIVHRFGIPAGRILAFIDAAHNSYYKAQTGFLGFFECIDQQDVADLLFDTAQEWLQQKGIQHLCGPMNFSIGNECGLQLDSYSALPYLQMNHTPPYYISLFEQSRFTKAHDLYAYKLMVEESLRNGIMTRLKTISDKILSKAEISLRPVNMKKYVEELESINNIYNETMKQNWGYVPTEMEEVLFNADAFKMIADPQMILIAEYKGKVVGCHIALPDVNQALKHLNGMLFPFGWIRFLYYKRKINRVRVYLLGILPQYRFKGLDITFYYMSILKALERGYKEAELSWVSEDNTSVIGIMEKIGATRYKTYRMFQKNIG